MLHVLVQTLTSSINHLLGLQVFELLVLFYNALR